MIDPIINQMITTFTSVIGIREAATVLALIFSLFSFILNKEYKKVNVKFYNIGEKYFEQYDFKKIIYISLIIFLYIILEIYLTRDFINDASKCYFIFIFFINIIAFFVLGSLFNKFIFEKLIHDNGSKYFNSDYHKIYIYSFFASLAIIIGIIFILFSKFFLIISVMHLIFLVLIFSIYKKPKNTKNTKNTKIKYIKANYSIVIAYSAVYLAIVTWIAINFLSSNIIINNFLNDSNSSKNIENTSTFNKNSLTSKLDFYGIAKGVTEEIKNCESWSFCEMYNNIFNTENLVKNSTKRILNGDYRGSFITEEEAIVSYANYKNPDSNKYIMLKLHPNGGAIKGDVVYWLRKGHLLTEEDLFNTRAIKNILPLKYWGLKKNSFNSALPLYVNYFKGNINLYAQYEDPRDVISGFEPQNISKKFIKHLEANNYKEKYFLIVRALIILNYNNNICLIFLFLMSCIILMVIIFFIVKELLFDPKNKNKYEFIEYDSGNKKYLIAEYKNTFMVMPGKEINHTLYLFKGRYGFINSVQDRFIKIKEYDSVKPVALCRDILKCQELLNTKKICLKTTRD